MTNAKESYEAKILETLINNNRELGEIKKELETMKTSIDDRFKKIDSKLNWVLGAVFAVGTGILAAIYSAPILTALGR